MMSQVKATVSANERANSMMKNITKRSPNIGLPLMSARLSLKCYLGSTLCQSTPRKALGCRIVGQALLDTCLEHATEGKLVLHDDPANRWEQPGQLISAHSCRNETKSQMEVVAGAHDVLLFRQCTEALKSGATLLAISIGDYLYVLAETYKSRCKLARAERSVNEDNAINFKRPLSFCTAQKAFEDMICVGKDFAVEIIPIVLDTSYLHTCYRSALHAPHVAFVVSGGADLTKRRTRQSKPTKRRTKQRSAEEDRNEPLADRDILAEHLEEVMDNNGGEIDMATMLAADLARVLSNDEAEDAWLDEHFEQQECGLTAEDSEILAEVENGSAQLVSATLPSGKACPSIVKTKVAAMESHDECYALHEAVMHSVAFTPDNAQENLALMSAWIDGVTHGVRCIRAHHAAIAERTLGQNKELSLVAKRGVGVVFVHWIDPVNIMGRRVHIDEHLGVKFTCNFVAERSFGDYEVVHPAVGAVMKTTIEFGPQKRARLTGDKNSTLVQLRLQIRDDIEEMRQM